MKKILSLAAALLVASCGFVQAGEFVSIDSLKIMQASVEGKELMDNIQKDINRFQDEVQKTQKELVDEGESLNKQAKVLSKEAMQEKSEQLAGRRKKLERDFADKEEQLRASIQKKQLALRERQLGQITQISAKEGWGAVIDKNTPGLLCVSDALDRTDQVLKAIDANYQSKGSGKAKTANQKQAVKVA